MKMVRVFSICALLFVAFQVADSVICPNGDLIDKEYVTCEGGCAAYNCYINYMKETLATYKLTFGCPEDAISNCTTQTKGIGIIKTNLNNFEYNDENGFIFVSGCGMIFINEKVENGTECIIDRASKFMSDKLPPGTSTVKPSPESPTSTPTSASNNKNGALKLTGILSFGWLLFTAAWHLY